MNRNEPSLIATGEPGTFEDTKPEDAAKSSHSGEPCPADNLLIAAANGTADSQILDMLAEHLGQCDKCVRRIETLIRESRAPFAGDRESESPKTPRAVADQPESGPMLILGRYRLGRRIGYGGMGNVYEAIDRSLGRTVAVKMLRVDSISPKSLNRFELEARALATLNHPNIVSLYEFGHHQGFPFLVMEHIAGGPLSKVLRGRPLASRTAARLLVPIARGVAHAHHHGVLHRDLKPSNILIAVSPDLIHESVSGVEPRAIDDSATPKIADFGLVRILGEERDITRSEDVVGTVAYLAPERISNSTTKPGPEADVYALGVILYECITGRLPFQGDDAPKTLAMIRDLAPLPPSQLKPDVPRDLETICLKSLEKDPRHRYSTADELGDDLQRFLDDLPIKARPIGTPARIFRWCRRNRGAAAGIAVALVSLTILSLVGWVTAGIRADLIESARASETEARRQAEIAEKASMAEKNRRKMAMAQFIRGTTSLNHFGAALYLAEESGDSKKALKDLLQIYRSEMANLTENFLKESDLIGESPEIMTQILSMTASAHARNDELDRSIELFERLEKVAAVAQTDPAMLKKARFFVMNAALDIGHGYKKRGENQKMIDLIKECLNRWSFDLDDPKATVILVGMVHSLKGMLRSAPESLRTSSETVRLDEDLAELEQVIASLRKRNP